MSKKNDELTCKLNRFENSQGVLRFEFAKDNIQELVVAKRFLPKNVKEGDIILIKTFSSEEAKKYKNNLARQILGEILKCR